MDTERAHQVLGISPPFDEKELKRRYHKAALRFHPDKNPNSECTEKFCEIQEAYVFLSMSCDDIVYDSCRKISMDAFRKLNRRTAAKIFGYVERFASLFHIEDAVLDEMRRVIESNTDLFVIRPTIQNLLRSEIYKLEHAGDTYYIPMWHDELTYDDLVVKCVPNLPDGTWLDERNGIHLIVRASIETVLAEGGVRFVLGDRSLFIEGHDLKIVPSQQHIIKGVGVPRANTQDVYDNGKCGDVVVHLELDT